MNLADIPKLFELGSAAIGLAGDLKQGSAVITGLVDAARAGQPLSISDDDLALINKILNDGAQIATDAEGL
jgi:hypothetical protein